jgi:hypothetical protein
MEMIRITVELVSANGPHRDRRLGQMYILNDGTGKLTLRNYDVVTYGKGGGTGRRGKIVGHPSAKVSIWNLIRKACEVAGYNK